MWRDYFGPQARIVGVDVDPRCADLPVDAEVVIGDQGDPDFLRNLTEGLGARDLVIDDGGHQMDQQLTTFRECWPSMRNGGLFLTERRRQPLGKVNGSSECHTCNESMIVLTCSTKRAAAAQAAIRSGPSRRYRSLSGNRQPPVNKWDDLTDRQLPDVMLPGQAPPSR